VLAKLLNSLSEHGAHLIGRHGKVDIIENVKREYCSCNIPKPQKDLLVPDINFTLTGEHY